MTLAKEEYCFLSYKFFLASKVVGCKILLLKDNQIEPNGSLYRLGGLYMNHVSRMYYMKDRVPVALVDQIFFSPPPFPNRVVMTFPWQEEEVERRRSRKLRNSLDF